jgi:hypothetical protein
MHASAIFRLTQLLAHASKTQPSVLVGVRGVPTPRAGAGAAAPARRKNKRICEPYLNSIISTIQLRATTRVAPTILILIYVISAIG